MTVPPLLSLVPAGAINDAALTKLKALSENLDTLMLRSSQGDFAVDKDALCAMAEAYLPRDLARALMARFVAEFPERLSPDADSFTNVDWGTFASTTPDLLQPTAADLTTAGLSPSPDAAAFLDWMELRYGRQIAAAERLDQESVDAIITKLASGVVSPQTSTSDLWTCLVRHLGWWGALGVFSALGAVLIILTATGGITAPLVIWLVATFGGGTATIIIDCAINPSG